MSHHFQIATLSPGLLQHSLAAATSRAGELAILDFEYVAEQQRILDACQRFARISAKPFGVRLSAEDSDSLATLILDLPNQAQTVLLTSSRPQELESGCRQLRVSGKRTLLEVRSIEDARTGAALGVDGLVAKGHEAGGRVGEETTFILLQRLQGEIDLPVWAQGGIGLHTAAACAAGGAAGIILDSQLALTRESPLPEALKASIASMDGSETICLGDALGEMYRMYYRPGSAAVRELQDLEVRLLHDDRNRDEVLEDWRQAVRQRRGWHPEQNIVLLGQDAAFAASLAEKFHTVGGITQSIRESIQNHCDAAVRLRPLAEAAPLAASNGTRYPILQGPMTRVSDVPEFAGRVAESGALPFLALALLREPEVRSLLAETQQRLGSLPWGVGILGFVPPELRQEQMSVIREYRPPFALIAGGRPDQARSLEQQGIPTYLHVPSPGLLRMFVQQGARRVVFEGRECGGHVGPRTSFVLWEQMVEVLLAAPELAAHPQEFHVVFAAGIHDALSAAMVSVIAAPLAERGVRVGALLGTAYLFTEEAVASGAILEAFQEQALECRHTVLLETGPGHSTRCVQTPFAGAFASEKRRLLAAGRSADEIRLTLEEMNLGRLRIASKGVTRNPDLSQNPGSPRLIDVHRDDQIAQGMYMIGQVAGLRNGICTAAALHHDVSVEGSSRLAALAGRSWVDRKDSPAPAPSDIAIVGMACLLPKAPDLETYWENILGKVNAVEEIPKHRWDWQLYFDADPKTRDKIYSKWGGFLDDTPFDPMQYGMPPATLRSIEPSHLLTLEVVRAALADAGYSTRPFPRERTSVILGAGGGAADLGLGYGARTFLPVLETLPEFEGRSAEIVDSLDGHLPEWTEDSFAGILTNVAAGRVANRFDLGGSNFTVDAACASSLAAVAMAVKELECGTSDMVLVGGVDTMQNPFTYLCFSKTHALSPRGRCRTFDETADGIAISEGVAIMVFKRLSDAERDGDRIYAVIKGVGNSSDGKDRGLTAPRPEGQARALRRAYAKAGVSPATVGLVEAHGTGTVAGDGAEVQALTQVFSEAEAPNQQCAIGSVKSMIGHTKCTAGAAGMVKAALALHHRVLPPTIGVENPNPRARFPETPFFVNTEPRPWLGSPEGNPRRAGVSAFGFGGTNFHVVLEEYTGNPFSSAPAPSRQWPEELFVWKAESLETLLAQLDIWAGALNTASQPALRDLAWTAWKQARASKAGPLQLSVIAASPEDLKQKLGWARESLSKPGDLSINDPRGIYFAAKPVVGKVAFLFPGQGSQYPRMLQDLFLYFPEMRRTLEIADEVLQDKLDRPLTGYIFPPSTFNREEERSRQRELTQTNIAQPALGAVSFALFQLLAELGLQPDMAAGHSYGEYVALAAAGVFDPGTLIGLSEARGRFIVEGAGAEPGTMAAVEAGEGSVMDAIQAFDGLCLANINAPRQCVISGPCETVERAVRHFNDQGTIARLIPVACAFHSPLVATARDRLAEMLSQSSFAAPKFDVFSNTTAAPYSGNPQDMEAQLAEHLVRPVRFVEEIEAMYNAGARVFVEVGPRGVLTGLVDQILGERPKLSVASNQNGRSGLTQLLHLLGQLTAHGHELKLDRLYQDRARQLNLRAIEAECAPTPLPPSAWMVNGTRATPLKEVPKAVPMALRATKGDETRSSRTEPRPQSAAILTGAPVPTMQLAPRAVAAAAAAGSPAPAVQIPAVAPSSEPLADVMAQFQGMMARFMETQKAIMLAYLGGGNAGADLPLSVPALLPSVTELPRAVEPTVEIVEQVTARPNEANPAKPASGPDRAELTGQLLAIVSERTGYPAEMLDLNQDLEADLGIDSIKRVEILGTFQQIFTAHGIALEEGLMENLSGVRTLNGIIDVISGGLGQDAGEAVPETPSQTLSKEKLTDQLLTIVSERTGYPREMLDLRQDMEADLGIDSIKRVEILGTFQQTFVSAGISVEEGVMEKLANLRTLEGIIDGCFAGTAVADASPQREPKTEQPAALPKDNDEEDKIRRYAVSAVETPPSEALAELARDRVVLITDDGRGIAREVAAALRAERHRVALIQEGPAVSEVGPGHYTAPAGIGELATELIALVNTQQGPIGAVVHLQALGGEPDYTAHTPSSWSHQHQLGVKTLFSLAQAAGKQLREAGAENGAALLTATAMGGSFLSHPEPHSTPSFPDHGAVTGLTKTLAIEWPEVRVKALDLDLRENPASLARHIADELRTRAEAVEVGYRHGRRWTLTLTDAALESERPDFTPDSSSVVLITGGARGITALSAIRLAELYQPTLVLVGRSAEPPAQEDAATSGIAATRELKAALTEQFRARGEKPTPALVERAYARLQAEREIRSNLAALRQLGAKIHYYSVDVRDSESFGKFIDGLYDTFGRIDGVIHGAGVIEDKLIADKTPESFDRVFETKAASAFVLSRKLRPQSLRFLMFFSSVSGRFGNRGQGDYAAANEVLNKLAVCLDHAWPGRVVAVNWGPWATEGMVSDVVRKQFAERGVSLISPPVGVRHFEQELRFGHRGTPEVVIGGVTGFSVSRAETAPKTEWPLLRNASFSAEAAEFTREINPAHDLFLLDHVLAGNPVLPLAVATELIAEAVAHRWPGMEVAAVRDLRVLHGIVLDSGPKSVVVRMTPGGSAAAVTVDVIGAAQPQRRHYRAIVELAPRLPEPVPHSVPALAKARPFSMEIGEAYRHWLFHGPTFQGISRITQISEAGVTALLRGSTAQGWFNKPSAADWLIDPLMFDSALQVMVLWTREHWDMTPLPTGFQTWRRFAGPPASNIVCEVRMTAKTVRPKIHADFFFFDAGSGRLLATIEDMQGAGSRELNRLAGVEVLAATGGQS